MDIFKLVAKVTAAVRFYFKNQNKFNNNINLKIFAIIQILLFIKHMRLFYLLNRT